MNACFNITTQADECLSVSQSSLSKTSRRRRVLLSPSSVEPGVENTIASPEGLSNPCPFRHKVLPLDGALALVSPWPGVGAANMYQTHIPPMTALPVAIKPIPSVVGPPEYMSAPT